MIKPLYLSYFSLLIGIMCLSSAFMMTGFVWGIPVILVVGSLWAVSIWRAGRIIEILSLCLFILGISTAAMADGSRVLLLASALAALAAWDLSAFHYRLSANEEIREEGEIIRTHLWRLLSVLILGGTLPLITFALQFDLKFWQVLLLGVVLLLGLSQVFSQIKRSNP